MLHHRSSREVSIAYFWVLLVGFVLWIAYGLTIDNWFLIVPKKGPAHSYRQRARVKEAAVSPGHIGPRNGGTAYEGGSTDGRT